MTELPAAVTCALYIARMVRKTVLTLVMVHQAAGMQQYGSACIYMCTLTCTHVLYSIHRLQFIDAASVHVYLVRSKYMYNRYMYLYMYDYIYMCTVCIYMYI